MGRGPQRCRRCGAGSVYPLLAFAASCGGPGGVFVCLCAELRHGLAARAEPPVAARSGRGSPGRGAAVRRLAGTRGAPRRDRRGPAPLARESTRSARDEDLGWIDVSADRRGPACFGQHGGIAIPLCPGQAAPAIGGGTYPMNESLDPLESELSGLQPLEMSSELRRGIVERLAQVEPVGDAKRSRSSWLRRGMLAGGLIAAGLAVIIVRWSVGPLNPRPIVMHESTPTLA